MSKDRPLLPQPRIAIADLVRRSRRAAAAAVRQGEAAAPDTSRLRTVASFGPNPGALRLHAFLPASLPPGAPLLVALHGCTQTAAGFDQGCGWSALAEERGFALLLPEQASANNPNRCFNWFEPAHTARGQGEAGSIIAMVDHMLAAHALDRARVFVTGLSAGGAMAAALLATHPEVFAAGAILAGLPHGAAGSMPQAFEAMATARPRPAEAWARLARDAAGAARPARWPRISVWHGEADTTVAPANAIEIVKQWTALHGLPETPHRSGPADTNGAAAGAVRSTWHGADGAVLVEHLRIPGLAHGVPIHAGAGEGRCGEAMPFILDIGLSAPHRIAGFLGLDAAAPATRVASGTSPGGGDRIPARAGVRPGVVLVGRDGAARLVPGAPAAGDRSVPPRPAAPPAPERSTADPGEAIRRALVAAGLLKP